MLDWIQQGVRVQWQQGPPRPFHHGISRLDPDAQEWWRSESQRYRATGALEPATSTDYVSRAFVVPKTNSSGQRTGWRLVVDLRHINQHCVSMNCRYETLKTLRSYARKNDYMISWDLQDGYHHLSIHPDDRKFFTFCVEGEYLQCSALPFGWNNAPAIFTKFMRPVVRFLRSSAVPQVPTSGASVLATASTGIRTLPYLDDFMGLFSSHRAAVEGGIRVKTLLASLGIRVHPTKCHWEPTQRLVHLGLEVDTLAGVFRVTASRQRRLQDFATYLIVAAKAGRRLVRARDLAKFCGLAQSCHLALPMARLFLRALYDALETKRDWRDSVRLSRQCLRDLQWWQGFSTHLAAGGTIWLSPLGATLHCDSSDLAWGGVLNGRMPVRGSWSDTQRPWHITLKELTAVRLTICHFLRELSGRTVLLHEDNQAVVAALTTLTSRSPAMMAELRCLWELLSTASISLRTVYIRSAANVWADDLSRRMDPSDYSVTPRVFRSLAQAWGPYSIDRFAAPHNALVSRFNSLLPLPGSEGTDAFCHNWVGENNWLHPPTACLPRTVQVLQLTGAAATVVAPYWPAQQWFPELCRLATEARTILPAQLQLGPTATSLPPARMWMAFRVPARPKPP